MGDARSHSKNAPRFRRGRIRAFAVLFLVSAGAAPVLAQCSGAIPNFRVADETPGASITLAWDAPGGAPPGTTYEIVRMDAPGYCSISSGNLRTFTTTSTTFAAILDLPNSAYTFTVRLQSDPTVSAGCQYATDTFPPPVKPSLAGASPTPGQAVLTYSYPIETAYFAMLLFRGTTAASQPDLVAAPEYCPAGSVFTFTDYGPGGSAAGGGTLSGPYFYRLFAYNFGSAAGEAGVPSDLISINVIGTCSAPDAPRNPTIASATNPGAPVTGTDFLALSWQAPLTGQPPSGYEYRINGDAFTAVAGLSAIAPPRGTNDPITLTVRARACNPSVAGPEVSSTVVAPASPGANFSFTTPTQATKPITFTDTSSPQATSWLWLFDDGTSETVQSPTHTFSTVGIHQVALIASNGSGSSVKVVSINVVAASASVVVTASRQRQAFDATDDPGRRRLAAVLLRGEGHTLVALRSLGTEDTVVYLRFLDRAGNPVAERRLVAPTGQEATQDIGAYGLTGEYTLEVVMSGRVVAALISDSAPQRTTRPVKRAPDEN